VSSVKTREETKIIIGEPTIISLWGHPTMRASALAEQSQTGNPINVFRGWLESYASAN
jgi:hypothetical protein